MRPLQSPWVISEGNSFKIGHLLPCIAAPSALTLSRGRSKADEFSSRPKTTTKLAPAQTCCLHSSGDPWKKRSAPPSRFHCSYNQRASSRFFSGFKLTTPAGELGLSAQPGWGDVRIKVHRAPLTASLGDNPPTGSSAYFSKIAGPSLAGFPASEWNFALGKG